MHVFWKATGLVVAGVAAVTLAFWLWIDSVADRKWSAMARRVAELKAEFGSPEDPRPVLHGPPLAGDPLDDYVCAFQQVTGTRGPAQFSELAEDLERARKALDLPGGPSPILSLPSLGPAVDRMRQGCRRTQWGRILTGLQASNMHFGPSDSPAALLARAALLRARALQKEGRSGESADLVLETAQMANDVGHEGAEHLALWIHERSADELRLLIQEGRLSPIELGGVERDVELLERSFVTHRKWMRRFLIAAGSSLLEQEVHIRPMDTLRFGFSKRLACASVFLWGDAWVRRVGDCDRKPWGEIQRLQEEWLRDLRSTSLPMEREIADLLVPEDKGARVRRGLARLRLLRLAAHYLSTGEWSEIEDPFGTKLLHSPRNGKLKAWSVGPDGTNDGGDGDWADPKGRDIVLEIHRKP
jgi:hypothetical protein